MASSLRMAPSHRSPGSDPADSADFVAFILCAMARKGMTQREMALACGIGKSRVGVLLHRDPDRRAMMSVGELQAMLGALGSDFVEAELQARMMRHLDASLLERHQILIMMLRDAFSEIPHATISLLEEVEGVDGTEIRRDWAGALGRAVVRRLVESVRDVIARRDRLAQSDDLRI